MSRPYTIIISNSHDPYINLGYEEFLLNEGTENFLIFYINRPSVIVGKHQNPWLEVNLAFCREENIAIIRRMTGGGAVFHDTGNINFSFIRNKDEELVNFKEHMIPVKEALVSLGFPVHITERNDLFADQKKISGNAQHINNRNKRLIHHGTLLVSADLDRLRASLNPEKLHITTHAVNSIRSSVKNLGDYSAGLKALHLISELANKIRHNLGSGDISMVDPESVKSARELSESRYRQWDWNFGRTPAFIYTNDQGDKIRIRMGKIESIESDTIDKETCDMLEGCIYRKSELTMLGLSTDLVNGICLES